MNKTPPFQITPSILELVKCISHELGVLSGAKLTHVPIKLRRDNKAKSIQASLAIEGNTLTLEQVTDISQGKKVIAPQKDIKEVTNAIKLYTDLSQWNPLDTNHLKKAHKLLMQELISDNGSWRTGNVGIFRGKEVVHMAPQAKRVIGLVEELFDFINAKNDISWLLKACIFHYEFEFIHPFTDGNGRMGRLWQQLLLMKENAIFEFIPIESLIKEKQKEYYNALEHCDKAGYSTLFVEFSLEQILGALREYTQSASPQVTDYESRLTHARQHFNNDWFTRKEYITFHKDISSATASRDLLSGLEEKILIKQGDKNQTEYKFHT